MKYYVVIAEKCADYTNGHEIVWVGNSETIAIQKLQERVNKDERLLAERCGYTIFEDSTHCFDSGNYDEGYDVVDYVRVSIEVFEEKENN